MSFRGPVLGPLSKTAPFPQGAPFFSPKHDYLGRTAPFLQKGAFFQNGAPREPFQLPFYFLSEAMVLTELTPKVTLVRLLEFY